MDRGGVNGVREMCSPRMGDWVARGLGNFLGTCMGGVYEEYDCPESRFAEC